MDRVRFGRALGVGARAAAKSLMSAAEAASAPSPAPPQATRRAASEGSAPAPARTSVPLRAAVPQVKAVATQAGHLKRSVWRPFAHFSRVLWLEVTGTFFAIFALMAAQQVWKSRMAVHLLPRSPEAQRLYVYAALLLLFGYFAVSSFVRARRPRG